MRVRVHDDLLITAENENNDLILAGNGKAMTPMKALLASFGGCTGIDVFLILQKIREDVKEINVYMNYKRSLGLSKDLHKNPYKIRNRWKCQKEKR